MLADDAQYPHCNSEVLHEPGTCYYCDQYPDRQAARAACGGFTPPEANGWSGNVAVRSGEVHEHLGARYTVGDSVGHTPRVIERLLRIFR